MQRLITKYSQIQKAFHTIQVKTVTLLSILVNQRPYFDRQQVLFLRLIN